jgi:predicted metal-dependent HD superfamily phosphohydrolase
VPTEAIDLLVGFRTALGRADPGRPDPVADAVAGDLLTRWGQPHRRYHTVAHLIDTLDAVRPLLADPEARSSGAGPDVGLDVGAIELAAWFHDAVYDGRPGDDEQASARLAGDLLAELGQPDRRVAEVVRLVRLTADHESGPDDLAGHLLCDADLSILGAEPVAYRRYADAIRAEYAHVPDPQFRTGRARVLRRLLDADPLFRTAPGRRRWEAPARHNLAAELAGLVG